MNRTEIVARFTQWLDKVLEKESPPQGPDAQWINELTAEHRQDESGDWFAIWSAITTLTQEIKLQGRTFKHLTDTIAPVTAINAAIQALMASNEKTRFQTQQALKTAMDQNAELRNKQMVAAVDQARKEMIPVLIQIRNRLQISLHTTTETLTQLDQYATSRWRHQMFKKKSGATLRMIGIVQALHKGNHLALDQIDDHLAGLGVREIDCLKKLFDPQRMVAADVEKTMGVPDGTVVEVYQPGYFFHDEVLYPAHVKVAVSPDTP